MDPLPDATALARRLRDGELTPREATAAAIARIEALDPYVNAVVAQRFDQALAEADHAPQGPLRGVPMLIKDLGAQVAGLPATRGSRLWSEQVADADSALVAAYRAAGAIVLGMTNTPELGRNGSTEPVLHGPTRNPWSTAHSTGGSSGGSAAAVAAGMVPVAHAGDGGGSIRIPAAMCGLVGHKPSRGLVSRRPDPAVLASPLATDHVVARSVRDSALLLDIGAQTPRGAIIAGPARQSAFVEQAARRPAGLRIGLMLERPDQGAVDERMLAPVRRAAALLEEMGHHVEPVTAGWDAGLVISTFSRIMGVGLVHDVEARLAELGRDLRDGDLEPFTLAMLEHYRSTLGPTDLHDALCAAQTIGWQVQGMFEGIDVVLSPTVPITTPELGVLDTTRPEVMYEIGGNLTAYTNVANLTGQPAISVPMGAAAGLPAGVQLMAELGQDGLLLALAAALEEAAPWPQLAPLSEV